MILWRATPKDTYDTNVDLKVRHYVPLSPHFVTGYMLFLSERTNQRIDGLLVLPALRNRSTLRSRWVFTLLRSPVGVQVSSIPRMPRVWFISSLYSTVSFTCRYRSPSPVLVNNNDGQLANKFKITIRSILYVFFIQYVPYYFRYIVSRIYICIL